VIDYTMSYTGALEKLLSLTDMERVAGRGPHNRRYDLGRIRLLLEWLGDPHLQTPTVHITGTKGKGSTAALIASVLSAQGYRPGLFTSPHLHTFRERIQLDGEPISEKEFASLVEDIWPLVESINADGSDGEVTTFELLTAMAFLHFQRSGAGFQVVEVGMGGRLDSTNLVQPQVCVLTSISLDHTAILGDTVERIAADKAGIIKPGSVIVVGPQRPEVMDVLAAAASAQEAMLVSVEGECRWALEKADLDGQTFTVEAEWGEFRLRTPLLGGHQLENCATALVAIQVLNELGFTASRASLSTGFRSVRWPARLEVLSREPLVVVDGAHNPYSAGKLSDSLRDYFDFRRLTYVVGVSSDKNVPDIAAELARVADLLVATRSRHPRAAALDDLADAFGVTGVELVRVDGVEAALEYARGRSEKGDLIVVTGSLFVAAEAREAVLGIEPELYPSLQRGTPVP